MAREDVHVFLIGIVIVSLACMGALDLVYAAMTP